MALSNLTYRLYTDSNLTIEFTGTFQVTHFTDLSDNPHDFTLYLGSTVSNRQLQTTSNPGFDQITLTPVDILPNWEASTAYSIGDHIQPETPNGFRYRCVQAGTSNSSEPTFPTVGIGSTVNDGTVIWELASQKHSPTEIKLALSEVDLDSATGGAPLDLGATILSGTANAVEIWIRKENEVTTVGSNFGQPEVAIAINEVIETQV